MTQIHEKNRISLGRSRGRSRVIGIIALCVILVGTIGTWVVSTALADVQPPQANDPKAEPAKQTAEWVIAQASPGETTQYSESPLVSDSELLAGNITDKLLASGIVERMTSAQLASRELGYMKADVLTDLQLAAARNFAKRHDMLNEQGQVADADTTMVIGAWFTREVYVSLLNEGNTVWFKLGPMSPRPPTLEAIANPPLDVSLIRWSSWPQPLPSQGIKTALRTMEDAAGQTNEPDGIGWRFKDLPLMYRNWIEEEWQVAAKAKFGEQQPPLDPENTNVIWAKAILFSVMLQAKDGGGRAAEIAVPAF